ncbi:MAG: Mov34/MPN/PAD-1 family protein [Microcoleaceae cyanobacterium]
MLILHSQHLNQIYTHAEQTYPHECCGLLMGRIELNAQKVLVEVIPAENAWNKVSAEIFQTQLFHTELSQTEGFQDIKKSDQQATSQSTTERHYTISPEILFKAQKQGRERNLSIIGIYHSHPDHPATPSEFDRLCAWSDYSYIIVSVQQGKAVDLQNWCLDEQRQFQLEGFHSK